MKVLIAEDDLVARFMIKDFLAAYGECDMVADGQEALEAFKLAWANNTPYDLICMDIMMPNMDGQDAIKAIRQMEKEKGVRESQAVKIIMITSLDDPASVMRAYYKSGATSYLTKPVEKQRLIDEIRIIGLIPQKKFSVFSY